MKLKQYDTKDITNPNPLDFSQDPANQQIMVDFFQFKNE